MEHFKSIPRLRLHIFFIKKRKFRCYCFFLNYPIFFFNYHYLLFVSTSLSGRGGFLSLGSAVLAIGKGGGRGVVDVTSAGSLDEEGRDVDESLADADVTLTDEDASVVDRLRKLHLVDHGLESSLEEVLGLESKHVIELQLVLRKNTEEVEATEECATLEDASLVVLVESEEVTCPLADLGEEVVDTVDLTLAAEPVDAAEAELVVETLLLVGTTRSGERSGVGSQRRDFAHFCV